MKYREMIYDWQPRETLNYDILPDHSDPAKNCKFVL